LIRARAFRILAKYDARWWDYQAGFRDAARELRGLDQ
jgi:hypothetical protein